MVFLFGLKINSTNMLFSLHLEVRVEENCMPCMNLYLFLRFLETKE